MSTPNTSEADTDTVESAVLSERKDLCRLVSPPRRSAAASERWAVAMRPPADDSASARVHSLESRAMTTVKEPPGPPEDHQQQNQLRTH